MKFKYTEEVEENLREECPYCGELFKSVNRHLPYCDENPEKNQPQPDRNSENRMEKNIIGAVMINQIENLKSDFQVLKGSFRGQPDFNRRPNLKEKIQQFEKKMSDLREMADKIK